MAQGTPVVSTAELGTRSILTADCGAYVVPEEEEPFAAAVAEALQLEPMPRRAQLRAHADSWASLAMARRLMAFYEKCVRDTFAQAVREPPSLERNLRRSKSAAPLGFRVACTNVPPPIAFVLVRGLTDFDLLDALSSVSLHGNFDDPSMNFADERCTHRVVGRSIFRAMDHIRFRPAAFKSAEEIYSSCAHQEERAHRASVEARLSVFR